MQQRKPEAQIIVIINILTPLIYRTNEVIP